LHFSNVLQFVFAGRSLSPAKSGAISGTLAIGPLSAFVAAIAPCAAHLILKPRAADLAFALRLRWALSTLLAPSLVVIVLGASVGAVISSAPTGKNAVREEFPIAAPTALPSRFA
jgi:hypothetical protein